MGQKLSCCLSSAADTSTAARNHHGGRGRGRGGLSSSGTRTDAYTIHSGDSGLHSSAGGHIPVEGSTSNLQHISEREPDEGEDDPSIHPKSFPIFMERSKSELNYFRERKRHERRKNSLDSRLHKHYSSCSTIFLDDNTVSQPNLKAMLKCVSLAICYHIRNRESSHRLLDIFDERIHPLTRDGIGDSPPRDPEQRQIYKFVRTLFNAAQLTVECAIITLVYLERVLTYAEIDLVPVSWKRTVLGAILLASKVWDDQAVWNVDYCQILKDTTVEDMNELERQYLEAIQFNINVPSSVYAKYYFHLRSLADANNLLLPTYILDKGRAAKLEAMSRVYESRFGGIEVGVKSVTNTSGVPSWRKWSSLDNVSPQCNRAIIS